MTIIINLIERLCDESARCVLIGQLNEMHADFLLLYLF